MLFDCILSVTLSMFRAKYDGTEAAPKVLMGKHTHPDALKCIPWIELPLLSLKRATRSYIRGGIICSKHGHACFPHMLLSLSFSPFLLLLSKLCCSCQCLQGWWRGQVYAVPWAMHLSQSIRHHAVWNDIVILFLVVVSQAPANPAHCFRDCISISYNLNK